MGRSGRAALLGIVFALTCPLLDRAEAHSGLRFSSPLDGATLGDSPTHVQLTFVEKPEASLSTIRVVDTQGGAYHAGRPEPVEGDPLSLSVRLRPLGRGIYAVHWRVVSAVDGHASAGVFVFGVLVDPSGSVGSAGTAETTVSRPEVLARSIFLAGLVVLLGAAAARLGRFGLGRELGVAAGGWLLALVGVVLLAAAQQRVAGVDLAALADTAIGRALIWRAVAISAAGIALGLALVGNRLGQPSLLRVGLFLTGLAALTAMTVHAAAGHAAVGRWPVVATIGFQTAHIAVVGIWLGGLAAVLAGLRGAPSEATAMAVRRFSRLAAMGLVVVTATGIVRSVHEITAWSDLWSTDYGRIVSAKVALLVVIAALGGLNRWRSVPRVPSTLQPLKRTAGVEIAVAGMAIAAAGVLGTLPPPAGARPIAGIDASGTDFATTVRARLTAASDQPGPNRFVVQVDDYDSKAPVLADRVSLRFTPLDDPGIASTSLSLTRGSGDTYTGSGANLTFDGRWRVGVLIERGGSSVEVPLDVETRSRPQFISILRPPGEAPSYTIEVRGIGHVRITPDPERAGPSRLHVTCFTSIFEGLPVDDLVVTMGPPLSVRQLVITRQNDHQFVTDVELQPGENRIAVIARTSGGARFRATIAIRVPGR